MPVAEQAAVPLTARQVAERLGVSRNAIYALIEKGEIGHNRIGGSIRITEEQFAEYQEHIAHQPMRDT